MATERTLDIFKVLDAINKNNPKYYDTLSEQQLKELQPFVVMRWVTGTSSEWQIQYVNELVNPFVFNLLADHKRLLFNLLTICGPGKFQKYSWIKGPSKKTTSKPMAVSVLKKLYNYSTSQAEQALALHTVDDILDYAEQLGYQTDEISKIRKEMK